jgi:hypothetical protein
VVSQASLDTPSFLIVRQADDQPVENQTDQGSGGKIIKYLFHAFALAIAGQNPVRAHSASLTNGSSCAKNKAAALKMEIAPRSQSSGRFIMRTLGNNLARARPIAGLSPGHFVLMNARVFARA